jgi:hypothetical protein
VEPIYKQTSHTFHLLATLCTCGVWAFCVWWWWAPMQAMQNNQKRARYQQQMANYQQKLAQYEQQTRHQWHQRGGGYA